MKDILISFKSLQVRTLQAWIVLLPLFLLTGCFNEYVVTKSNIAPKKPQIANTSISPRSMLVRGGDSLILDYTINAEGETIQAVALQKSLDGGLSFQTVSHLDSAASQTSWQSPNTDITDLRFRVLITLQSGRTKTADTFKITVDATPPLAPAVSLFTPAVTNSSTVRATVAACTDRHSILLSLSASAPASTDPAWATCSTAAGAFSAQLLADGIHTLYAWAKDAAGNVSDNSSTVSTDFDGTPPLLTLNNLNNGETIPANTTVAFLWTASDAHFGANPIGLQVSSDSGISWSPLATGEANDGIYSGITPNVHSTTYRIRITATDTYGNATTVSSSADFTITNIAPAVSFISSSPSSPSAASTTPNIIGATGPTTTSVTLYSDSSCLTSMASGSRATFIGAGISVTIPGNSSQSIYAKATDGSLTSSCSYLTTYTHDSIAPAALTYLYITPSSPTATLSPKIFGLASSDVTLVEFFSNVGCTTAIGSGSRGDFAIAGPGISLSLTANATTSIYGRSLDAASNASSCNLLTTAVHDNISPDAITALSHAATMASVTTSPAISWTLATDNMGGTGVASYEVSVGVSAGGTQILAWSTVAGSAAPSLPLTLSGLNLTAATTYYVNVRTVDNVGNKSSIVSSTGWLAQTSINPIIAPASITLEVDSLYTFTATGGTPPYTYSIQSGQGTINANTGNYTAPSSAGGPYTIRVTDNGGITSDAVVTIVPDRTLPVISNFSINGGQSNASGVTLPVAITATDPGTATTGIAGYRFSTDPSFTGASWKMTPPTHFTFGFDSGVRTLYAQVRDGAGNLSAVASSSTTVFIGTPPSISLVKPDGAILYTAGAQSVHVSWSITSTYPIAPTGIDIYYTTNDGITLTPWPNANGLSPNSNGCTIDAGATGCAAIDLPPALANNPFKLVVRALDTTSSTALVMSPPLNIGGLTLFAGANVSPEGGSARSTALENSSAFAIDPINGDMFVAGTNMIWKIPANTGIMTRFAGIQNDYAFAGDDQPVANARFTLNTGWQYHGKKVAVDHAHNVYWASEEGIWKYDAATGNASIWVGPMGAGPRSMATGTHRRDLAQAPSQVYSTPDGRIYFSVRVHWNYGAGNKMSERIYKIEADETVTWLAGCSTDPCPDAINGMSAQLAWVFSWSIKPGTNFATDELHITDSSTGIYRRVEADGTLELRRSNVSRLILSDYLSERGGFATWGYPQNQDFSEVYLWDLANPAAAFTTLISSADSFVTKLVEDAGGNLLFSTLNGRLIYTKSVSGTDRFYAGITPNAGDGGLASMAQLRSPDQISFDTNGVAFIHENLNGVRRIETSGTISTLSMLEAGRLNQFGKLATGVGSFLMNQSPSQVLANPYGNFGSIGFAGVDATMTCVWFCGASIDPEAFLAPSALDARELYRKHPALNGIPISYFAYDGTDMYVRLEIQEGNDLYSSIKKIASNGNFTEVAGDPTVPDPNTINVGTALLNNNIGGEYGVEDFRAANGVLFMTSATVANWSGYRLFSGAVGGNWVQQSNSEIFRYTINPADNNFYFTVGTKLFRKAYTAMGGAPEIEIKDFAGVLTAPQVGAMDSTRPHTVLIMDGDSVYRYTDSIQIP
jgi:hypothetical protein